MMASELNRDKREEVDDSKVLPETWTEWITIIKPKASKGWEKKTEKENWYTNVAGLKQSIDGTNGIYELRLKKGKDTCVVYIGSSCAKCGLCKRLSQYVTNGAHKAPLIQTALSAGTTIQARACIYEDCKTAHKREDEMLAKFDYLWNERSNLTTRKKDAFTTALFQQE